MGWILILAFALAVGLALWRFAGFDRASLQLVGAALLLAMAGYAWQGRPGLAGRPPPERAAEARVESAFAEMRHDVLGRFDLADSWLTIAEGYERRGNTRSAVDLLANATRQYPLNSSLWIGLGDALVLHADGRMSPAARLAFERAIALAPRAQGPRLFYGLALVQAGEFAEADKVWRDLLAAAPPDASWRPLLEQRIALLAQLRAMIAASGAPRD
jgi:cytochrome c-type biogenesis protein CcmH/NrfG